jgi:hypothetical protein
MSQFIGIFTSVFIRTFLLGATIYSTVIWADTDWEYSVRPGDSLWSVCAEYTAYANCWQELQGYNQVSKPRQLAIGEKIKIPVKWLKQPPYAAQVVYVNGDVFLLKDNQRQKLVADTQLAIGETVIAEQGNVTLQFIDGSLLSLAADGELTIDAVSAFSQTRAISIDVSLPRGEVKVSVPVRKPRTKLNVHTRSSIAAVRGTEFRVASEVNGMASRSEVLEGRVAFMAGSDTVDLSQGFGSAIQAPGEQPLAPVPLISAPEWILSCTDPGYVEWSSSAQAVHYKLALLEDDPGTDKIIATRTVKGSNFTFADLENGCYQVRVNAVDDIGFSGMESQRQLCYNLTSLDMPVINSARYSKQNLYLEWDDVSYAALYTVDVALDETFESILYTGTVENSELQLALADEERDLHVRVQAHAGERVHSTPSEPVEVERQAERYWLLGVLAGLAAFAIL